MTGWPSYTPQAPGSLFVAFYDSMGYNGVILSRLHRGNTYLPIRNNGWNISVVRNVVYWHMDLIVPFQLYTAQSKVRHEQQQFYQIFHNVADLLACYVTDTYTYMRSVFLKNNH
jgi:hypothetical protein